MMKIYVIVAMAAMLYYNPAYSQTANSKRGVAYGHLSEADIKAISPGVSWWYNWFHLPEEGVRNVYEQYNMDFVPMAWDENFNESGLRAFLQQHPNVKYLLAFNEPNFTAQANLGPKEVAALWPKLEAIAKDFNLKLVGPAVNWCGSCVTEGGITYTDPYKFIEDFLAACPNCQIDYLAVHNYMCYSGSLIDYLDKFKKYHKKLWLTEFACWDQATITLDMQKSLVMGALDYLDNDTMIYRYAWFTGNRQGNAPYIDLFEQNPGQLSALGKLYVNYKSTHDTNAYTPVPARIEAESYAAMSGIALETTKDIDGNANVGWIDAGDWLQYNLYCADTADMNVYMRIASNGKANIEMKEGDNVLGNVSIESSGGWQNWKTYRLSVHLTKGNHKIQLYTPTGLFNLNWIYVGTSFDTPPAITGLFDTTLTLPVNELMVKPVVVDADNNSLTYRWTRISGNGKPVIEQADSMATKISGLTAGTYVFALTASDSIETTTAKMTITVLKGASVSGVFTDNIMFFPNPATDKILFNNKDCVTSVKIFNLHGMLLLTSHMVSSKVLDISQLTHGVYIIDMQNATSNCRKLLFKN